MKRLLLGISLAALSASIAQAADLAPIPFLKAPTSNSCTLQSCNGFYVGLNVQQQGGQFTLLSNGLGGLAQTDFAMGGQVGAELYNGQWRIGFEAGFDYGLSQVGTLPNWPASAIRWRRCSVERQRRRQLQRELQ
jgi:opacity protein-like surface antigen